jgi:hypothetical protein
MQRIGCRSSWERWELWDILFCFVFFLSWERTQDYRDEHVLNSKLGLACQQMRK